MFRRPPSTPHNSQSLAPAPLTLQLLKLAGLGGFWVEVKLANVKVSKETVVIGGSHGKENLGPAKRRNGINGCDTVGNFRARKARSNIPREAVDLRDNESNDSQLSNCATERNESVGRKKATHIQ